METDCNCTEKEIIAMQTNGNNWQCPQHGRVTQAPGFSEARTQNNETDWQREAYFWRQRFWETQQAIGALQEAMGRFSGEWPTDFQAGAVEAAGKAKSAYEKAMEHTGCMHRNGTPTSRK